MSLRSRARRAVTGLAIAACLVASGSVAHSASLRSEASGKLRPTADLRALRVLPDPSGTPCGAAIRAAELRYGLPSGLLFAIGQVELGRFDAGRRRVEPWPWTIQAEGRGIFFQSKAEAVQWVKDAEARGLTSIDTGCMQVNLFYHPQAFSTPEEAFDPERNADYAARFLVQLRSLAGDSGQATGFYHSQTQTLAASYRERVGRALNGEFPDGGMVTWPLPPKPPSALDHLVAAWGATLGSPASTAPRPPSAGPVVHDWNTLYSAKQLAKPISPWQPKRLARADDKTFLSSNIKRLQ